MNLENLIFAGRSGLAVLTGQTPRHKYDGLHKPNTFKYSNLENLNLPETQAALVDVLKRYSTADNLGFSQAEYWQTLPWSKGLVNSLDLFGLLVSFTDFHKLKIPGYLIPPVALCREYIDAINTSDKPLLLAEQFDIAMSQVGPYPMAAALLAMLSTRAVGRDMDNQILPGLNLDEKTLQEFPFKIGSFGKDWVGKEPPDPTGNTYYFFTTLTMGMALQANTNPNLEDSMVKWAFDHGVKMMWYGRIFGAWQPNQVTHKLPAEYGFKTGFYLANRCLSFSL